MAATTPGIVNVGDVAPDLALTSLDGVEVTLARYRGAKVVLFMWASW